MKITAKWKILTFAVIAVLLFALLIGLPGRLNLPEETEDLFWTDKSCQQSGLGYFGETGCCPDKQVQVKKQSLTCSPGHLTSAPAGNISITKLDEQLNSSQPKVKISWKMPEGISVYHIFRRAWYKTDTIINLPGVKSKANKKGKRRQIVYGPGWSNWSLVASVYVKKTADKKINRVVMYEGLFRAKVYSRRKNNLYFTDSLKLGDVVSKAPGLEYRIVGYSEGLAVADSGSLVAGGIENTAQNPVPGESPDKDTLDKEKEVNKPIDHRPEKPLQESSGYTPAEDCPAEHPIKIDDPNSAVPPIPPDTGYICCNEGEHPITTSNHYSGCCEEDKKVIFGANSATSLCCEMELDISTDNSGLALNCCTTEKPAAKFGDGSFSKKSICCKADQFAGKSSSGEPIECCEEKKDGKTKYIIIPGVGGSGDFNTGIWECARQYLESIGGATFFNPGALTPDASAIANLVNGIASDNENLDPADRITHIVIFAHSLGGASAAEAISQFSFPGASGDDQSPCKCALTVELHTIAAYLYGAPATKFGQVLGKIFYLFKGSGTEKPLNIELQKDSIPPPVSSEPNPLDPGKNCVTTYHHVSSNDHPEYQPPFSGVGIPGSEIDILPGGHVDIIEDVFENYFGIDCANYHTPQPLTGSASVSSPPLINTTIEIDITRENLIPSSCLPVIGGTISIDSNCIAENLSRTQAFKEKLLKIYPELEDVPAEDISFSVTNNNL